MATKKQLTIWDLIRTSVGRRPDDVKEQVTVRWYGDADGGYIDFPLVEANTSYGLFIMDDRPEEHDIAGAAGLACKLLPLCTDIQPDQLSDAEVEMLCKLRAQVNKFLIEANSLLSKVAEERQRRG